MKRAAGMATRRLASAVDDHAFLGFPEAIFVEALPDGAFLNQQDVLGGGFSEFDHLRLDDAGYGPAAGAHVGEIDYVAVVDNRHRANHGALGLGVDAEFLAQGGDRDLDVFDDGITFGLLGEDQLAGGLAVDCLYGDFQVVEQVTNAG
jgi:hypothetical protein